MDKVAFVKEIARALTETRRTLRRRGLLSILLQLPLVIGIFVLLRLQPSRTEMLWYCLSAFAICNVVTASLVVSVNRSFIRNSPVCPACQRAVGTMTWRKVLASGKCVHCGALLYTPVQLGVERDEPASGGSAH